MYFNTLPNTMTQASATVNSDPAPDIGVSKRRPSADLKSFGTGPGVR